MEQRIYFDEGKLVVETDNGKIKDSNTTTKFCGEFVADADTVAMLLSELEGHSLTTGYVPCWTWGTKPHTIWSLITGKEIAEELKNAIDARNNANDKLDIIIDRINKHNNNKWWRFWERKIDISDIV